MKNLELPARARILFVRGVRVILDMELAVLYCVSVKRLKQQVRRNATRFPKDFMFSLTWEEAGLSRSQNATLNAGRGFNLKYLPLAFTEQGVAMLSSVLKSERAIQVNIAIMRAFVKMRRTMAEHRQLSRRLDHLEQNTDARFKIVFEEMERLRTSDEEERANKARWRIGFAP